MKLTIPQNREYVAEIIIMSGEDYYTLSADEKLIFGVKKSANDTNYIITKEMTNSQIAEDGHGYILCLSTTNTNVTAGYYYYDIVLKQANGELIPVFLADDFVILPSVVRSVAN